MALQAPAGALRSAHRLAGERDSSGGGGLCGVQVLASPA
jgi:hypothetical protein